MVFNAQNGKIGFNKGFLNLIKPEDFDKINKAIQLYNQRVNSASGNQAIFAESMKRFNPQLSSYLTGLNGANASMKGYGVHLVGATIKTVALQAASMALNAAITWGVSLAIQGIISLGSYLWKLVPTAEHLKKQLEEVADTYKETKDEITSLNKELTTTQDRIDELSAKKNLSFTEASELERLKAENAERKHTIYLLEKENKERVKKAQILFNQSVKIKPNADLSFFHDDIDKNTGNPVFDFLGNFANDYTGADKPNAYLISTVKAYRDMLDNLFASGYEYGSDTTTDNKIDDVYRIIDAYDAYCGATNTLYATISARPKYAKANEEIQNLLDSDNLNTDSLSELYKSSDAVKEFVDYLFSLNTTKAKNVQEFLSLLPAEFEKNKNAAKKTKKTIDDFATSLSKLNKLNNGLSKITDVYEDISNGGSFDFNSLLSDEFIEEFGKLDSYKDFVQTITKSPDDISACQKAFNKLTSEYVQNSDALQGVTDDTKDIVIAMLEQKGVANAAAIVEEQLKKNTEANSIQQRLQKEVYEDKNLTLDKFINKLYDESDAVNISKNAYVNLIAQETIFNNSKLDVTQKIEKLQDLAEQAGLARAAIAGIDLALSDEETKDSDPQDLAKRRRDWANSAGIKIDIVGTTKDKAGRKVEDWVYTFNGKTYDTFDEVVSAYYNSLFSQNTSVKYEPPENDKTTNETAEDEIKYWKHQHEMGLISEATYYKKLEETRKQYYAGKKDYLDRDRELQEEYHKWEVENAEDGFDKKIEALQNKYANSKITYAKLKSEITKLIKSTFRNDKDTLNKYLKEVPDYLNEAQEQKEEKKVSAFNLERSKLKDRLEMGKITEATYYKELKKIRDKYKNSTIEDIQDGVKDINKELHDYSVSQAEISFESKLKVFQKNFAKGIYSEKGFKSRVKKLIKSLFKNDKQKQQEFLEQIDDYLNEAQEQKEEKKVNEFNTEVSNLKYRLEMGEISEATYYKKLKEIRNKYKNSTIQDIKDNIKDIDKELHDYDVSVAEKTFEKEREDLVKQYANGKISYTKLKSDYIALIKSTFSNDKDTKNKYLNEASDFLSDARDQKDEKNKEDFDASYDKLKYQFENGFISEETYYKRLDTLYKKHYGNKTKYLDEYSQYSQEVYDGFKEMYKKDLEADKKAWEEKKEAVSEYYDELIEKIQDAHDEEDYEEEQTEKRQTLSDIERQIAELEKDGSEKAKARIAELEEDRKNAEKELEDFEKDHARQEEIERLEKEKEAREKEIENEIKNIDKQLDDLNTNTATIRDLIIDYAKKKGVTLDFAYASGTRSSVGGVGRINEKGIEMISAPDGNGNYIPMLPNSYVFSAKATEFLWKLATEHSLPQAMYSSIAKSIKTQSSTPSVNIAQPITITMGDVIIKGNADKQTVADIKKQQENTVRMVLQKIKELQK